MRKKICILILNLLFGVMFVQAQNIVAAEYFFDSDPGVGNGTSVSITAGAEIDITTSVSVTGLLPGFHSVFFRFLNSNGDWSLYEGRRFYIRNSQVVNTSPQIVAAEYFYDTDPGVGSGTAITLTVGNEIDLTASYPTTGLAVGFHSIFFRFLDDDGTWSLYEGRHFYIRKEQEINTSPKITAMEYFIGSDPGFGNGTAISITAGDAVGFDHAFDMSGVAVGDYSMSIRVKDEDDVWSIAETKSFSIANCSQPTPDFSIESSACVGSTLTITDLSSEVDAGATYEWDIDNDGTVDYTDVGNIEHEFIKGGMQTVVLQVINEGGCSYKAEKTIEVYAPDPKITVNGNVELCEGQTVELSVQSSYESYQWSSGESSETIVVNTTGDYSVTVTEEHGCEGTSDEVTITVSDSGLPVISSITKELASTCLSADATLTVNSSNSPLQYSIDGGQNYQASNVFNGLSAGNYKVMILRDNDCTAEEMVNLNPSSFDADAPEVENVTTCFGTAAAFTASSSDVKWYNSEMAYKATGTSYSPTDTESGVYDYYALFSENNCQSEVAELTYTIYAMPGASFSFGNTLEKCKYDTVKVSLITTTSNVVWSPTTGLSSSTIFNPDLFVENATSYSVTANNNGCKSTTNLQVNVKSAPDKPTIDGKTMACYNETNILYTTTDDNSNSINWTISGGSLDQTSNDSVYVHWNSTDELGNVSVQLINPVNSCGSPYNSISVSKSGNALEKMDIQLKGRYILYISDIINTDNNYEIPQHRSDNYQWYFNGEKIEGATEKWLQANTSSDKNYSCLVVTPQTCQTMSNPYNFKKKKVIGISTIKIYPNPTKTELTVDISDKYDKEQGILKIININGEIVKSISVEKGEYEKNINLSNLKEGNYILYYISGNKVYSSKFVKE